MSDASPLTLSAADARRLAITTQGLCGQGVRLGTPVDVLRHLGAIQLDAIQRVDKAHRLVCLARVATLQGRQTIDQDLWSADGEAAVFESWAHAVCLLPMQDWPLWNFARRRTAEAPWAPPPAVWERVIGLVEAQGPLTLRELENGAAKSSGWNWSETKTAAEYLLWTGRLVCAERRGARRVYDLPQRRVPAHLLNTDIDTTTSLTALVGKAAKVCGIATLSDVAEYFRLSRTAVASVWPPEGTIEAIVDGWPEPAWVHPAALHAPFSPADPVFLTPFDNLVWDRERTRRLFGFDLVLEAYKPATKRRYGYYAMPLLIGDSLTGRADLARDGHTLHALSIHFEPGTAPDLDAVNHAGRQLATQLGCHEFVVSDAAGRLT